MQIESLVGITFRNLRVDVLAELAKQGIVKRRTDARDRRYDILTISRSSLKLLGKYANVLACFSAES